MSAFSTIPFDRSTSPTNSGMLLCTTDDSLSSCGLSYDDLEMEVMEEDLVLALPVLAQEQPRLPTHVTAEVAAAAATAEPAEPAIENIRNSEIEIAYEQMEADVMMDILAELEDELAPAYYAAQAAAGAQGQESLLWNVVATPDMMRDFAQHHLRSMAIPVA